MTVVCAYCGNSDDAETRTGARIPAGDFYWCDACGELSVYTEDGLRKATRAESDQAKTDWRKPGTVLPTVISFDARG